VTLLQAVELIIAAYPGPLIGGPARACEARASLEVSPELVSAPGAPVWL
jgi:hypothetical protein